MTLPARAVVQLTVDELERLVETAVERALREHALRWDPGARERP